MSNKRHNTRAGEDQNGSSGDNIRQQQQESRDPEYRNARDRSGRTGGDNAKKFVGNQPAGETVGRFARRNRASTGRASSPVSERLPPAIPVLQRKCCEASSNVPNNRS